MNELQGAIVVACIVMLTINSFSIALALRKVLAALKKDESRMTIGQHRQIALAANLAVWGLFFYWVFG